MFSEWDPAGNSLQASIGDGSPETFSALYHNTIINYINYIITTHHCSTTCKIKNKCVIGA